MLSLSEVKTLAMAQGLVADVPARKQGRQELARLRRQGFRTYPQRPLSYSSLREFAKGPLHYVEYLTRGPMSTAPMTEGKVFEACLLGRELAGEFVIFDKPEPTKDFRNKANQQARKVAQAEAQASGRDLILAEDLVRIQRAAEIARQHPFMKFLRRYKLRQPGPKVIVEPCTQLRLVGIPDLDVRRGKVGVDIKFVHSVAEFEKHLFGRGYQYWLQAAVYSLVYGYEEFYFFASQNQPFVYAQAFQFDREVLAQLRRCLVEQLLMKFRYHLAMGFLAPSQAVQLPEWMA